MLFSAPPATTLSTSMVSRPDASPCPDILPINKLPAEPMSRFTEVTANTSDAAAIVSAVRAMVWDWLKPWGPVTEWGAALTLEMSEAQKHGTVHALVRQWDAHREIGKGLAQDLREIVDGQLPLDEQVLKDLFRQVFDLLFVIDTGLSILDTIVYVFNM